jgi:hypothetical protein
MLILKNILIKNVFIQKKKNNFLIRQKQQRIKNQTLWPDYCIKGKRKTAVTITTSITGKE